MSALLISVFTGLPRAQAQTGIGERTDCDRLAASAYDENAVGEPVTWLVLGRSAERAIAACRQAHDTDPETPRFQYQLARAFDAAENYREARVWYEKVAELPYPAALAELAVLHANGKGMPGDPALAYSLAARSAELGNLRGMTIAAAFKASGLGTERDREAARSMMMKAAEGGHAEAMEFLGDYYLSGAAQDTDEAQALDWFLKAAERGRLAATMSAVRLLYKTAESRDEAHKWAKLAARSGHAPAMAVLGTMFLRGEGTRADPDAGLFWLERAAETGEVAAIFTLGRIHEVGDFVPEDLAKAREYYEKGVAANSGASAYRLARGYDDGRFGDKPELAVEYLVFSALTGFEPARTDLLSGLKPPWTEPSRMALQSSLAAEGLYSGAIDGVIGPGTAGAVRRLLAP